MRPSSRMLSCQPDDAVIHCPGGVCATRAAIAFCTSAIEREDKSWTAGEFNAANSWCRCVSISPGTTVRPPSSTICVDGPTNGAIKASAPTATKRPSRIATASAMPQPPLTVMMRPPRRIRSAGCAAAPVTNANTPASTNAATRRAEWSCMACPHSSPDADHNLAEMLRRLQMAECRRRLVEWKDLVDDRLEAAHRDGAVHGLEHLRGADRDALHVRPPGEDRHRVDLGGAGEHADHGDFAADADGAQRLRQSGGPADLDHVVHAAAGQLDHGFVPVRNRLVVHAV